MPSKSVSNFNEYNDFFHTVIAAAIEIASKLDDAEHKVEQSATSMGRRHDTQEVSMNRILDLQDYHRNKSKSRWRVVADLEELQKYQQEYFNGDEHG